MTARSVVEHALRVYYDDNAVVAGRVLAQYDTAQRAEVLHEAINRLNGVAETAPESRKPGLDYTVGVLLDMVSGRDKSAGGASS